MQSGRLYLFQDSMRETDKILILGARGMVGSAVTRRLRAAGYAQLLTPESRVLDARNHAAVGAYMEAHKPDVVILAAARVGGIHANNSLPADFIFDNLAIATAAIENAYRHGVKRLFNLGSSCIYPRDCPQPIKEEYLMTGPLEATNEAYAIAKIAALKMAQFYRRQHGVLFHSAMPTNLYGPGDNYHPTLSHVLPAFIRRFHEAKVSGAKTVTIWGTGTVRREFLHTDDLADGILHLLQMESPPDWVNLGTGVDVTIRELAELTRDVVGAQCALEFDTSKPDGTPRKLLDVSMLTALGWKAKIGLREGLERTYASFLRELEAGTVRK